ncbi:probable alpha-ketoglutarate-dependent hypophosphite dioxygenase [Tachysurus fulvidraco]|uniref:probable alpha-ketoglutarate-dependent hypophosphite dioxygenase n=1 Tax=Tachysurus fulvidraco TaxID=1234273 RepID=UPI001FEF2257|nr:probable alpha-ketoglutarate-dependent hypophosphite dioxygenase [Tachysurus fulvidraco]
MGFDRAEVKFLYENQGYVTSIPILSPEQLQQARNAFAELERKFGEDYTSYSLHNVHMTHSWVMDLVKHPRVLEVITAVLGPDVLLLDSRFICKYPVSKQSKTQGSNEIISHSSEQESESILPYVAWHQDMKYWGLDGGPVVSVWLALDDSQVENGALQVIPGSHCSGLLPHRQAKLTGNMLSVNQEIPEELVEKEKALFCPLLAGQMSIHDGLLVHGSDPNTSGKRRCGFVIRYVPTAAYPVQDPERPRRFHATVVVSGHDKYNHFSSQKPEL